MASYRLPALQDFDWQPAVSDKHLTAPPGTPSKGDRYIVGGSATGDWSGHDDDITYYDGSAWQFDTPSEGWMTYIKDEDKLYFWDSSTWGVYGTNIYLKLDGSNANTDIDIGSKSLFANVLIAPYHKIETGGKLYIHNSYAGQITEDGSHNLIIEQQAQNLDIIFKYNDGGVTKQIKIDASQDRVDLNGAEIYDVGAINCNNITCTTVIANRDLDLTGGIDSDIYIRDVGTTWLNIYPDGSGNITVDVPVGDLDWSDSSNSLTLAQAKTAYNHSQDNSQAHSDYLINNGNDETSGTLTAGGFTTSGTLTDGTASLTGGSLTSVKLGSLTNNGFVKTSGGNGTLSVDTSTYLETDGSNANSNIDIAAYDFTTTGTATFGSLNLNGALDLDRTRASAMGNGIKAIMTDEHSSIIWGGTLCALNLQGIFKPDTDSAGGTASIYGISGYAAVDRDNCTGTVANLIGCNANCRTIETTDGGAITVTNARDYHAETITVNADDTIENAYGLYVADQTAGTNNYGVYTAGTVDSYFGGDVSALSFTDRTPAFDKTSKVALDEIIEIKNTASGEIDHNSLPSFAQKTLIKQKPTGEYRTIIDPSGKEIQEEITESVEVPGRSLSALVTMLTEAIKELKKQNEQQQAEINTLQEKGIINA